MPNWSGTVLTAKGLALQAKVEAGTPMEITKLKIGDGVLGGGQSVSTLNDLVSPKKIVDISALTPLAGGTCKIHGIVTNDGVETGFYVRELGVFADDPDLGEILYAYTADGAPDFLPAEGGPLAVSEELVINLTFSNAASITASIAMDGLVTVAVMQNAVTVHNADPAAHGGRYLPIAGGTMTGPLVLAADPTADMQAATKQYADNNGGVNLRKNLHAYAVGDICYSKSAASYKYMQCTVAGVTAASEPVWPDVGQTVIDGGVTWVVRDIRVGKVTDRAQVHLSDTTWGGIIVERTGGAASSRWNIIPGYSSSGDLAFFDELGEKLPLRLTGDSIVMTGTGTLNNKSLVTGQITILNETQQSGISGGTFSAGAWRQRVLNTVIVDRIGIILSSNQFTLPAGAYIIRISAPAAFVANHQIRLYNISDSSATYGTSEYTSAAYSFPSRSFLNALLSLTDPQTFEIQHRCNTTKEANGFGVAVAFGNSEIYTSVEIWKVG